MKVYNTLTRQKEEFIPREAGTVKKALKSPQCGDFLQVLVLHRRRRFVRHRKKKAGVCLENMGFSADVGAGIRCVFER